MRFNSSDIHSASDLIPCFTQITLHGRSVVSSVEVDELDVEMVVALFLKNIERYWVLLYSTN